MAEQMAAVGAPWWKGIGHSDVAAAPVVVLDVSRLLQLQASSASLVMTSSALTWPRPLLLLHILLSFLPTHVSAPSQTASSLSFLCSGYHAKTCSFTELLLLLVQLSRVAAR